MIHNAITRAPEVLAAYDRALGLEDEAGIERVSETLTPTFDLWEYDEWAYLRNERLWARRVFQAAVVGELSSQAIVNPAGSGHLIQVEAAGVTTGAVETVIIGTNTAAVVTGTLALSGQLPFRDTRWIDRLSSGARVSSIGLYYTGSDPASIAPDVLEGLFSSTTAYIYFVGGPWILSPGQALVVEGQNANTSLITNFIGRERRALPGELRA